MNTRSSSRRSPAGMSDGSDADAGGKDRQVGQRGAGPRRRPNGRHKQAVEHSEVPAPPDNMQVVAVAGPQPNSGLSSSHQIVLRDLSNRNMVVHNPATRRLTVYSGSHEVSDSSRSMESCPMCLRPLYTDYDDADIGRTQDGAFHASPHVTLAHDYFMRLGEMHYYTTPNDREEICDDVCDDDDDDGVNPRVLSERSFNNGYYDRFFTEQNKLGSGGFGSVFLCEHVLDGVTLGTYACKKIPVGDNRPWLLRVLSEIRAVETLRHPNIVAYKHSWLELNKTADFGPTVPVIFMLMEYANMGNIADYICKAETLPTDDDVWSLLGGICRGLRHLHHSGIVHRDIKPGNLLLNADYDVLSGRTSIRVLISDFGESDTLKQATRRPRTGNTGTMFYCAPELLDEEDEYDDRADIYSLGVVLYFMCYGRAPYEEFAGSASELHDALKYGTLALTFPEGRSGDMVDLIVQMTRFDRSERPSIDQVLQHHLLRNDSSASSRVHRRPGRSSQASSPPLMMIRDTSRSPAPPSMILDPEHQPDRPWWPPALHIAATFAQVALTDGPPFRSALLAAAGCGSAVATDVHLDVPLWIQYSLPVISLLLAWPAQSLQSAAILCAVALGQLAMIAQLRRRKRKRD